MSRIRLTLLESIGVESGADEVTVGRGEEAVWGLRFSFKPLSPALKSAIESLKSGAESSALAAQLMATDGFGGIGKLRAIQKKLEDHGFLAYTLLAGDHPFATLRPVGSGFAKQDSVEADTRVVLSRFASVRRTSEGALVVASPTGHAIVELHDPRAVTALHHLARPTTAAELAGALSLDAGDALTFISFFVNAGCASKVEGSTTKEESDPALGQWSVDDLTYHVSNRLGRHSNPYGATYRNAKRFESPPVVKAPMSSMIIPLQVPDLEKLKKEEPSFTEIQERRRSVRTYGEKPIRVDQLGELLYRSARIKKLIEEGGVSWRPSAAGGAIHELEIYPAVLACEGLEKGLYHYDPKNHALEKLADNEQATQRMLILGAMTGVLEQPPQVLLVVAARFQRVQNKYDSVAYSVMLKNVGCLYQTMYLVAEAMGLAACAIGGGDSDLFAKAAGLDYYAETSVGEFLLGSGPIPRTEPLTPPKAVADGRPRWT